MSLVALTLAVDVAVDGTISALQRMAATFALTTDQANKLRLGKNKQITLFYGEWPA